MERVKTSREKIVNIMSDSRSSLDLLGNPKSTHPLAKSIKECIRTIRAQGRQVRLFWLRAHVGTAGNERADELAKTAALQTTSAPDYSDVPPSYVKRKIREETVRKWQDRYNSSSTGSVTKTFFPNVDNAYRVVRKTKLTPLHVQLLTGHGGLSEYLHRFKLKSSPRCECDTNISESVWHIILDCPRFQATRMELEIRIEKKLIQSELHKILADDDTRPHFLKYAESALRVATERNKTTTQNMDTPHNISHITATATTSIADKSPKQQIIPTLQGIWNKLPLQDAEPGTPRLRLKGVALFMDHNTERLGIAFCNAKAPRSVTISPGLAVLLKGSTTRTSMRRKKYEARTASSGDGFRVLRTRNKVVVIFEAGEVRTEFAQACSVLENLTGDLGARIISVDAMVVAYEKGEVRDYIGVIKASEKHEVVVYEDRGQNLGFLTPQRPKLSATQSLAGIKGSPIANPEGLSGSERLQERVAAEGATEERKAEVHKKQQEKAARTTQTLDKFLQATGLRPNIAAEINPTRKMESSLREFLKQPRKDPRPGKAERTKASIGLVTPPELRQVTEPLDHVVNAFLEFRAILAATRIVSQNTCRTIMDAFRYDNEGLLAVLLEEANAAVYNNETAQVLKGQMAGSYMAAFNMTKGLVELDSTQTEQAGTLVFQTPPEDPIVVVAKCTRVMLDDRILERAQTLTGTSDAGGACGHWSMPEITWVNGVPGCGKTTWVINQFNPVRDIVLTTTTEAAKDLKERLTNKIGPDAAKKVRTMASILVNGMRPNERCNRIVVDEALMNHFGAIVMAIQLTGAEEVLILGDNNQLPFIDRDNLFNIEYARPNKIVGIHQQLLCTHRNPIDVAYALNEIYDGIYSSQTQVRSLSLEKYSGNNVAADLPDTLFLVLTQAEKELLIGQGYGGGEGSRTLTVHEAQGLTYDRVYIIRTTTMKSQLRSSVPHALVAISRHKRSCTYLTDSTAEDAIANLITKTRIATDKEIMDYNLKMALRARDWTLINTLTTQSEPKSQHTKKTGSSPK